jgi:hypothetical protein
MSYPIEGPESIMSPKAHGTSAKPCQKDLMYGCDFETADKYVCSYCVSCPPCSPLPVSAGSLLYRGGHKLRIHRAEKAPPPTQPPKKAASSLAFSPEGQKGHSSSAPRDPLCTRYDTASRPSRQLSSLSPPLPPTCLRPS